MLGLFTRKKHYREDAISAFSMLQAHARNPLFYKEFKVPDTTEGRFDLLTLHLFMIIECMKGDGQAGADFSQALFDVAFESIDQGYREIGIGDMGVPKRMKKHMLAFNGRLHAYSKAYEARDIAAFADALDRNIYDKVHFEEGCTITQRLSQYSFDILAHLKTMQGRDIIKGQFQLINPERYL